MRKLMLLCAATIGISGCASWRVVLPEDTSCSAYQIIRPSRSDTLDTKRQVLAHNSVYRKLCGGDVSGKAAP